MELYKFQISKQNLKIFYLVTFFYTMKTQWFSIYMSYITMLYVAKKFYIFYSPYSSIGNI